MRVSFLEIYNEELFDLLSLSMDNQKMRLFEDSARKVRKYYSAVWSRSRLTLLHLNNTCGLVHPTGVHKCFAARVFLKHIYGK